MKTIRIKYTCGNVCVSVDIPEAWLKHALRVRKNQGMSVNEALMNAVETWIERRSS